MTRTVVMEATPKIASTFVITLLIASIIPLSMLSINPSIIPKAAATSPTIIFRNDFEPVQNYTNWDWKNAVNGTISNDYTYYTNGTRSFKFTSDSSKQHSYGYVQGSQNISTQITDTMWVKMDSRINPYPSSTWSKIRVFELLNSATSVIAAISFYKGGNGKEMLELKTTFPTTQWNYSGNLNLQPNQWYNIEFKFYKHSTQGEYRVYINGMEVITLRGLNTDSAVPVKIRVGAPYTDLTYSSWTAWLDNVTVSKDYRIGTAYTGPVFKDGFELGFYENWDWNSTAGGTGTLSYDTTYMMNGSKSLKYNTNSATGTGWFSGYENLTNLSQDIWMQMYVRLDTFPVSSGNMVEFFELRNSTGPFAALRFYKGSDSKQMIELKRWTSSGTVFNYSTSMKINTNTWQKIEFRLYRDSSIGQYRVYINESEVISILNIDTSSSATIPKDIWVGAPSSSMGTGASYWNIWVDDVTISTFRVTSLTGRWNCGDERVHLRDSYFYAEGIDNSTSIRYGLKAEVAITNPYICGTDQNDGSVGGAMIGILKINGYFLELGWYKGIYTNYSLSSLSVPHYFRGYNDAPGATGRHYIDLSTSTGTYPVVNNPSAPRFPTFTIYGNINTSNKTWTGKIENADDSSSTITTSITMGANNGTEPMVWLEFHNNMSSSAAHFKNIQNGLNGGGYISWQNWTASHQSPPPIPDSSHPYRSREITNKEYCMYTKPQVTCP